MYPWRSTYQGSFPNHHSPVPASVKDDNVYGVFDGQAIFHRNRRVVVTEVQYGYQQAEWTFADEGPLKYVFLNVNEDESQILSLGFRGLRCGMYTFHARGGSYTARYLGEKGQFDSMLITFPHEQLVELPGEEKLLTVKQVLTDSTIQIEGYHRRKLVETITVPQSLDIQKWLQVFIVFF